jgi:hypothetical protein
LSSKGWLSKGKLPPDRYPKETLLWPGIPIDDAQETALEGLITIIESIQEHAIDEGVAETEVYPHLEPV